MNCDEIRERIADVAAGFGEATPEEHDHFSSCVRCAGELKAMRKTMALLDEWQTPEPSPYFDVRLQARLREEMAKEPAGWMQWFRRPVLAAALTVLMGVGVGLFFTRGSGFYATVNSDASISTNMGNSQPGTAVSDLQALDKNNDLYSNFELLDDLAVQQDVVANP